jgi:hypothetical protein
MIYYVYLRWDGVDWIDLTQDKRRVEGSCEHGDEPSRSIKCWEVLESSEEEVSSKHLIRGGG